VREVPIVWCCGDWVHAHGEDSERRKPAQARIARGLGYSVAVKHGVLQVPDREVIVSMVGCAGFKK
jgi:hypothetical protein